MAGDLRNGVLVARIRCLSDTEWRNHESLDRANPQWTGTHRDRAGGLLDSLSWLYR